MSVMKASPYAFYTRKQIEHYQADVSDLEDWKLLSGGVDHDLWEELIGRANELYGRLIKLGDRVQAQQLSDEPGSDGADNPAYPLLADWLRVSRRLASQVGPAATTDGGRPELLANIAQAGAILTPDDEFFGGDELAALRDAAIEDDRAGRTELIKS